LKVPAASARPSSYSRSQHASHAALGIADSPTLPGSAFEGDELVEADVLEGVRSVPLSMYWHLHTRICRPLGLTAQKIDELVAFAVRRIRHRYDLKTLSIWRDTGFTLPPPACALETTYAGTGQRRSNSGDLLFANRASVSIGTVSDFARNRGCKIEPSRMRWLL
jgi:hypothetical protein